MYFTPSHEWIEIKGQKGVVGISDYAQRELGEIVYLELPKVGQQVRAGQEVCVLESTKAATDVYAPVSGKVTAVNEALKEQPSQINRAAEQTGWLFEIELTHPRELEELMSSQEYAALVRSTVV